ncbi:hypothetical protein, partial [Mesorhizobium sp. M7A.F.Ca.CA.004.09.1.2]|uniref:hypothetical protein n=1 Tax=Mesorhizobium sp. M7A.F.Ca.CA.004.09.1.2 TaxID=2496695 RepID=UPI000FD4924B
MDTHENGIDPGEEQVLDDIIDLEEYAKLGKQPPLAKGYRLQVNGKPYVILKPVSFRERGLLAKLGVFLEVDDVVEDLFFT